MTRRPARLLALLFLLLAGQCMPVPPPIGPAGALKLMVREDGLYRVTFDELRAAGLTLPDGAGVALSEGEQPVPAWSDGAGLIFYGRAPTGRYVPERSYVVRPAAAPPPVLPAATAGAAGTADCGQALLWRTVTLEDNSVYLPKAAAASGAIEPWLGAALRLRRPVTVPLALPAPPAGPISVTLRVWSVTESADANPDHHLRVLLRGVRVPEGGQVVSDVRWDGATYYTATFGLPAGPAPDALVLDTPGDLGLVLEQAYLDRITLRYPARVDGERAVQGELPAGATSLSLAGYDRPPVVVDVTRPDAPVPLAPAEPGACPAAVVSVPAGGAHTLAISGGDYRRPARIAALRESAWRDRTHQADEIIVTDDAFVDALKPLIELRRTEGITAVVVPVADIFDDFGGGAADPEALHAFLQYAHDNWRAPAPRFVLLAGSATYDYRRYLPTARAANRVPTTIVRAEFTGETVSDEPYADLDGDKLPDLAIGRWPADTPAQIEHVVARMRAYAQAPAGEWRTRALFIADSSSPDFAAASDQLIAAAGLPEDQVVRVYQPDPQAVVDAWNRGTWLVNYAGHGSVSMWGKDGLMTPEEVRHLRDAGGGPLVLTLTCLSGFYAHPEQISLGEELLWAPAGGAVGVVSATSLTLPSDQDPFGRALMQALRDPQVRTLGEALLRAKRALDPHAGGQLDVIQTFGLLGDPALPLLR
jgi:hypothetical protein